MSRALNSQALLDGRAYQRSGSDAGEPGNQRNMPMKTDFIYVTVRQSRAMFISMLLAMWGAAAFVANAANILWQGGTDSYTNVADWVGGVVPTGTNNAVNDNGTNNAVLIN